MFESGRSGGFAGRSVEGQEVVRFAGPVDRIGDRSDQRFCCSCHRRHGGQTPRQSGRSAQFDQPLDHGAADIHSQTVDE